MISRLAAGHKPDNPDNPEKSDRPPHQTLLLDQYQPNATTPTSTARLQTKRRSWNTNLFSLTNNSPDLSVQTSFQMGGGGPPSRTSSPYSASPVSSRPHSYIDPHTSSSLLVDPTDTSSSRPASPYPDSIDSLLSCYHQDSSSSPVNPHFHQPTHRRINSLLTPQSFQSSSPMRPSTPDASLGASISSAVGTGTAAPLAQDRAHYTRAALGRTRSLQNTPSAQGQSKRWSSSVIPDYVSQNPSRLYQHHASSSSSFHRRNSSLGMGLGVSPHAHPQSPGPQTWLTEQERLLQEKLQQLARSENARLSASDDPNMSPGGTSSSVSGSASGSNVSSPLISSVSSVGTSPRNSFLSSPNPSYTGKFVPVSAAVAGASAPIPIPSALSHSSLSNSHHHRHLSLQSYYNSNDRAPEMLGSSPQLGPIYVGAPATPASAATCTPTTPTTATPPAPLHAALAAASGRPLSPRALARAAALSALNNGGASGLSASPDGSFTPSDGYSRRGSIAVGSASALHEKLQLFAGSTPGTPTTPHPFSVLSRASSPKKSKKGKRHSRQASSASSISCDTDVDNGWTSSLAKPMSSISGSDNESDSEDDDDDDDTTIPDGYYIISASDLERLQRMEHIDAFGSLVDISGHAINPRRPGEIGGTVLSWRMTADIMRTWMTAYRSPAALLDLLQFVWAMATNGEVVREELGHLVFGKDDEDAKTEGQESAVAAGAAAAGAATEASAQPLSKHQGSPVQHEQEKKSGAANATSQQKRDLRIVQVKGAKMSKSSKRARKAAAAAAAAASSTSAAVSSKNVLGRVLPPRDVVMALKDAVVLNVGAGGLVRRLPGVGRVLTRGLLAGAVDWTCAGLAFSVIFIQVVLIAVMTVAYLLGDALVYPVRRMTGLGSGSGNAAGRSGKALLVTRVTRKRTSTISRAAGTAAEDASGSASGSTGQGKWTSEGNWMEVKARRAALKKSKRRSRH